MGVDMFIVRISRLNPRELDEIENEDFDAIDDRFSTREWDEDTEDLFCQIKPYIAFIERTVPTVDLDLAKKACGIPEDAEYIGEITGQRKWFFKRPGDAKEYVVDYWSCDFELQRRMNVTKERVYGVYKADDIFYLRNHHDLRRRIRSACDVMVRLCGYYPLNDKMRKCIVKNLEAQGRHVHEDDLKPTPDSVVCYHEWY